MKRLVCHPSILFHPIVHVFHQVGYVPKLGPIAPEPVQLGGLGPDLNNEERLKKAALREKMKEFGKNVHTVNTVMMPAAPVVILSKIEIGISH
jgi:hypothetical protein